MTNYFDTVNAYYANENGEAVNATAVWNSFGDNEWFVVFGDFSQVPKGTSVQLGYSGEATTLNWSNGLQQAGGPTE